jgi:hypothetical protein
MASTLELTKDEGYNIVNGDIFRRSWMCRRIAKWFGVEWVMAADEMAPLGNADGKGRRGMEGDSGRVWFCGTDLWRPASPRLTDLGLSRPIEVTTDMALSRELDFPAYQNMADHSSICSRGCARTGSFRNGRRTHRVKGTGADGNSGQTPGLDKRPRHITVRPQYREDPVESGRTLFG